MNNGFTPLQEKALEKWSDALTAIAGELRLPDHNPDKPIGEIGMGTQIGTGRYSYIHVLNDFTNPDKPRMEPVMFCPESTLAELTDQLVGPKPRNEIYRHKRLTVSA